MMEQGEPAASVEPPAEMVEGAVDISPKEDGGVMKVILREGSVDEKPNNGDEVLVHYVGTLLDGSKFDSSRDRNEQFSFKLGQGQVIKAWDIGVASMKRGETCRLVCREDYAYGTSGSPPKIPPNATLVFTIELFDWKGEDLSEDKDGGIIRSIIKKGEGYITPTEDSLVNVSLKGMYNGVVFDERSVAFKLGEGEESGIVDGVDIALRKLKKGETSLLTLSSKYAFGSKGQPDKNVPANAQVKYEVTLNDLEKAKESYEMEPEEKLEQCELAKIKGTSLLKANNFIKATKKYKRVIDLLDDSSDFSEEQMVKRKALKLAAHLNTALCQLKTEDWDQAKESCCSALELDSQNEKALFRRGQAYMGTKDWDEAKANFSAVLAIDSENKTASNQLKIADHHIKLEREKSKKTYAGMFQKFAEQDAKRSAIENAKGINSEAPIGYWSNDMAKGMMSIQQEMEAFGERMPERSASAASNDGDVSEPRG